MPPQPLSSIGKKRKINIVADPAALEWQPAFGQLVAHIISLWSAIEANLGVCLSRMLKTNARTGIAMYMALNSANARNSVLRAAAKSSLPQDKLIIFEAILRVISKSGAQRHKLAHWLWAFSPEIKDAVLLIDPEAMLNHSVNLIEYVSSLPKDQPMNLEEMPDLDLDKVLVYKERDFHEIIHDLGSVWQTTQHLSAALIDGRFANEAQWSLLSSAPKIQEALAPLGDSQPSPSDKT